MGGWVKGQFWGWGQITEQHKPEIMNVYWSQTVWGTSSENPAKKRSGRQRE